MAVGVMALPARGCRGMVRPRSGTVRLLAVCRMTGTANWWDSTAPSPNWASVSLMKPAARALPGVPVLRSPKAAKAAIS